MKVSIKGFTCPKEGENNIDNFDRYNFNLTKNKFAIADGVSLSFFPDIWAKLLVDNFIENDLNIGPTNIPLEIENIQNAWLKEVETKVNKPDTMYYVRNAYNLQKSGSSTFLGLEFLTDEKEGIIKWKCFVLGDSFLFYKKKEETDKNNLPKNKCLCCRIIKYFAKNKKSNPNHKRILTNCLRYTSNNESNLGDCPEYINHKDGLLMISSRSNLEFDNQPDYLDSRNQSLIGIPLFCEGIVSQGSFYLMTDAIADWFIQNQDNAYNIISDWKDRETFLTSIQDLRKCEKLKNDDTSILILEIKDDDNSNGIFYNLDHLDNLDILIKKETNE